MDVKDELKSNEERKHSACRRCLLLENVCVCRGDSYVEGARCGDIDC